MRMFKNMMFQQFGNMHMKQHNDLMEKRLTNTCVHCAWSASDDVPQLLWCKNVKSNNNNKIVHWHENCEIWTRFVYTSKDDKKPGQVIFEIEKVVNNENTT